VSSQEDRRSGNERRGDPDRDKKSTSDRRCGADRRTEARIKKRIRCEVTAGDTQQRGFVLDVSPNGLFVQTPKPIDPGEEISLELTPAGREPISLRAKVARSRRVPAKLASVANPGVGLRITLAPPEWYELVAGIESAAPPTRSTSSAKPTSGKQASPPDKPPAKKKRKRKLPPRMAPPQTRSSYRVKAKHIGGPRSRSLIVSATSREDAESQALDQLGNDWKVIDVEGA
jgi:hypothetical protein